MPSSFETACHLMDRGRVWAECGPMRLIISAYVGRVPQPLECLKAAEASFDHLARIARRRSILSRPHNEVPDGLEDDLPLTMIRSVLAVKDRNLTPMAAVAGTIADETADFLYNRCMTKVIVDNGGDVAVRLRKGESVRVGLRPDLKSDAISHRLALDDRCSSWGIATSGLGGRSLTLGIASAVTVVAERTSVADAAATSIANHTFVDDESITRMPACELDPASDIARLPVVVDVGPISEGKVNQALDQGLEYAAELIRRQVIIGVFISVKGRFAMTDFFEKRVTVLDPKQGESVT